MTEPLPPKGENEPVRLDPSLDELTGASTRAIADVVSAVIASEGVRWVKAKVTGVHVEDSRRFLWLQRAENDGSDGKPYPAISPGFEPQVGEWVHCLETPGGLVVVGLEQWSNDHTLYDVAEYTYTHAHDTRYYTKGESNDRFSLDGHNHHGSYYTKGESNDRYASASHGHSQYASENHTHGYLTRSTADSLYATRSHSHGTHRHTYGSGYTGYSYA